MNPGIPYQEALDRYQAQTEHPPAAPLADADALLRQFHPDYYPDTLTNLRVGPNRGDPCHRQLAQLLEADARIDEADLAGAPIQGTDILVIGGGGAGCAAALTAARMGARVTLATKLRLGDSNTVMAEGGIQASILEGDTPQAHFEDTIRAGRHNGDQRLVAQMVMDGPEVVRWLIQQGMQFDTDKYGDLLLRRAGGISAERVACFRDYTGLEMMRALREAVFNSDIGVVEYSPAVELLSNQSGHCAGAVLSSLKSRSYRLVKAKAVILATGGAGRLHINGFPTSNHFGATGDGLVLAYRLGARLRDLDSFQYHPSGLIYPQHQAGHLITEGVRAAGAFLLNSLGERFVDELLARDLVSSAILRECKEGRGVLVGQPPGQAAGVWLDTPGLERRQPGILQTRFPKLLASGRKSGIDPMVTPLLIYPTLHYQNGGVVIDRHGLSSVPGLYCVGEVSGGIHGKNRLMGNSLLDIISFGRRAGAHAVEQYQLVSHKKVTLEHLSRLRRELTLAGMPLAVQSPLLFPTIAGFENDSHYDGLRRNKKRPAKP